jgi:hypothetical protein
MCLTQATYDLELPVGVLTGSLAACQSVLKGSGRARERAPTAPGSAKSACPPVFRADLNQAHTQVQRSNELAKAVPSQIRLKIRV